jgi:hypothetical protein
MHKSFIYTTFKILHRSKMKLKNNIILNTFGINLHKYEFEIDHA